MSKWRKAITSGSIAELKSLISDSDLTISGSQIILKNLPTSDPLIVGKLWSYTLDDGRMRLMVSEG
tara:strand:+ start:2843 stop:3040 length:198 start_codon:yes stop_codon:yes gene_type:complete